MLWSYRNIWQMMILKCNVFLLNGGLIKSSQGIEISQPIAYSDVILIRVVRNSNG